MNKLLTILLLFALPLIAQEERIISLSPALTELVFKLGKGQQLIARSEPCDYPPEVKKLPVAGRFADPDMERILTLRPTIVITNDLINPGVRTVMENAKIRCVQKQCRTEQPTDVTAVILNEARRLLAEVWDGQTPIRQVGLGVSKLTHESAIQMSLFEDPQMEYYREWDRSYDEKLASNNNTSRL